MDDLLRKLQAGDQLAFEQLANALVSRDNSERKTAESFYEQLVEHHPDVAVRYLGAGLSSSASDMKHFCCLYLRKAVRAEGVWDGCSQQTQDYIKQHGMECLAREKSKALMRMLADTMSQVTAQTWAGKDKWMGVLEHMNKFITSGDPHLIEVALILFAKLTEWLGQDDVLQNMQRQMYDVLLKFLREPPNDDCLIAACKAATNFILSFEDEAQVKSLTSLVPPILAAATTLLQKGQEQEARDVLIDLSDIAELEASLFKPHYAEHTATLLQAACNEAFDSETRQAALELVIAIVEAKPGLMRKDGRLVAMLCEVLMGLLLDIEDTEMWHAAVEEQHLDDGQDELHDCGLQGLDRIARPIGGKALLAHLWPLVDTWSKDSDWRKRYAALMCIAQIAEGCRKVLLADAALASLVAVLTAHSADAHPIVKWSVCQAIGQVCTDLEPKIQKKYHGELMKVLLHLMGPQEEARVRAHAASAVVNFCEHLDGNVVGLYLKALLDRFMALLESDNQLVVESGLTATSSVADSAEALFKPYYGTMMPALKSILQASMERKSHRRLCGKALECISLIGMSVGKETFYNDAMDFMGVLLRLNATELEPDDPVLTYAQSAGTRMCKCLGHDFVQMLPVFVPPLLRSAGKKSELTTVAADEVDEGESDEYQYYNVGDRTIRISTAHTDEKVNALNMLACYAEHLQEHFAPYCAEVAKVVDHVITVPLLNDEEMRGACATLVPLLLEDMQLARAKGTWPQATDAAVKEMYDALMKAMLKALDIELDATVTLALYDSLDQIVETANDGLITPDVMAACFKLIIQQVDSLMEQRREREEQHAADDLDEEDLEQLQDTKDEQDALLEQVISAAGSLLKRFEDAALPFAEQLLQQHFSAKLMEAQSSHEDRWTALMLVSDMVEHCPSSGKYLPSLMPKFIECARVDNKDLVNVACYCLGVVAEKHPAVHAQHHAQVLETLGKVIATTKGHEDWDHCRDNAVTALGKILFHQPSLASGALGAQLGKLWLDNLPICEDDVEAGPQHEILHQLVLKNDPRVLGEAHANLGQIASVFVRVIARGNELLKDDNVEAFQAFFFKQLAPVLQQHGCNLQADVEALEPQDRMRFTAAAQLHGAGA